MKFLGQKFKLSLVPLFFCSHLLGLGFLAGCKMEKIQPKETEQNRDLGKIKQEITLQSSELELLDNLCALFQHRSDFFYDQFQASTFDFKVEGGLCNQSPVDQVVSLRPILQNEVIRFKYSPQGKTPLQGVIVESIEQEPDLNLPPIKYLCDGKLTTNTIALSDSKKIQFHMRQELEKGAIELTVLYGRKIKQSEKYEEYKGERFLINNPRNTQDEMRGVILENESRQLCGDGQAKTLKRTLIEIK